jgi:ubiquinone/menaquinone biosynthesis C-methylase UbiE
MTITDSTKRFSDRVADYVKYRPGYPAALVPQLLATTGLDNAARVADIGSGTGIFSKRLLEHDLEVFALEPNGPMRAAAEEQFDANPLFHSIDASAEQSGLETASIDLITAAQAFHWFNNDTARDEFRRILKPGGQLALIWNKRDTEQPFQQVYDNLLREFAPEYGKINHMNLEPDDIERFFEKDKMEILHFDYCQRLDFVSLLGRLKSSSYCPAENSPLFIPLVNELLAQFDRHAHDGQVKFDYDTQVYLGGISR